VKKAKKGIIECSGWRRTPPLIPQILRFGRNFKSRKTTRRSSLQNRKTEKRV